MIETKRLERLFHHNNIGLYYGSMGLCIYLSELSNKKTKQLYSQLCLNLKELNGNICLRKGMTGIALTTMLLNKKGIIVGNISSLLNEIDNAVFRIIAYDDSFLKKELSKEIEILLYLIYRYEYCENDIEKMLYTELICDKVDSIIVAMTIDPMVEPISFSLNYNLPKILYVLSLVLAQGLYKERIQKALIVISHKILYKMPILESNRLYLLFGLTSILKKCNLPNNWNSFRKMLVESISLQNIIENECKGLIYLENGLSSIYLLAREIPEFQDNIISIGENIIQEIDNSKEMDRLISNEAYLKNHLGLYNGYCGVALIKCLIQKDIKR